MAGRGRRLLLGELPLRGAARLRGDRKEAVLGGGSRCAGLLNGRAGEEAASGGAHPGGAHPAARGCSIEGGRRLLLGELPLRGAARLRGVRKEAVLGGSSRCAGLLNGRAGEEAAFGGAPAARGCSIEGGSEGGCFGGGAPAARGCSMAGRGRRLLQGELIPGELIPLRGAARLREGGGCFWGISRCAGLLD